MSRGSSGASIRHTPSEVTTIDGFGRPGPMSARMLGVSWRMRPPCGGADPEELAGLGWGGQRPSKLGRQPGNPLDHLSRGGRVLPVAVDGIVAQADADVPAAR